MIHSSDITAIDNFCGAGGSTTGLKMAGIRVIHAANHWQRAIDSHNTNHPEVDHSCVDLNKVDPRYFPRSTILWASPECFPAGTLILSERGLTPIEDIQIGDLVLTHKNRWMPVTQTMKAIKDTVIVKGRWSSGIETTIEHPFWVRSRLRRDEPKKDGKPRFGEPEWLTSVDLTVGNKPWKAKYWALPINIPALPIPKFSSPKGRTLEFSEKFWWMVGRWLGDGCVRVREGKSNSEVTICCGKHEADDLEPLLNFSPVTLKHARLNELKWRRRDIRTATLFECGHDSFARWLVEHFGKLAHGKKIPTWAFTMPEDWRKALLAGYVSADGYIGGNHIKASTVSKKLGIGITLLAESLGFSVSLSKTKQHCNIIESRQLKVRDSYCLSWRYPFDENHGETYKFGQHSWGRIKEVHPGRKAVEVFNLSVAEDESYVADGIIVHNCTGHSPSGGRAKINGQMHLWEKKRLDDPAVSRSRMTAMDVIRFTEVHKYQTVIVENVVEFSDWGEQTRGDMFEWWLKGMHILGYEHQIVCYNSMFGYPNPTPQSRDRLFVVFHRRGNRKPNVNFCPPAVCPEHGQVNAVQAWKKHVVRRIGKYGRRNQYLYVCPTCGIEVTPRTRPARDAIDWSLPMIKIGDRPKHKLKPLSVNTVRRIQAGLERFVLPYLMHTGHWQDMGRVYASDQPSPTQTTKREMGVVAQPAFMVHRGYSTDPQYDRVPSVDEPAPTQTTSAKLYLAQPFIDAGRTLNLPTGVEEPTHTVLSRGPQMSLITPPEFIDTARTHNMPTSIDEPTSVVTTGRNLSLIQPPSFLAAYHGGRDAVQSTEQPSYTVATNNQFGVVQPEPFISSYYGTGAGNSPVREPSPTICTVQGHALVEPDWSAMVDECGYRMLQSHEAKWLQGFPRDYTLLGNQEEQFKQAGNAVPPIFAEMLGYAVIEALS